jgi:hypothetical protein
MTIDLKAEEVPLINSTFWKNIEVERVKYQMMECIFVDKNDSFTIPSLTHTVSTISLVEDASTQYVVPPSEEDKRQQRTEEGKATRRRILNKSSNEKKKVSKMDSYEKRLLMLMESLACLKTTFIIAGTLMTLVIISWYVFSR